MKKLLSLLLLVLMLLLLPGAVAEEATVDIPLQTVYALPLGSNAMLEVPIDWGYQLIEEDGIPPIVMTVNDQMQMIMAVALSDDIAELGDDPMGLSSFLQEGLLVMLGVDTAQSTRLSEMTINDMPAVLVNMDGQGFDILWVGDSGSLYFFMFPNEDEAFVAQALHVVESFCVFHLKDEAPNPATDFTWETQDDGTAIITEYVGESKHVMVPDMIDGIPVTALGEKAFYEKSVTTVVVPDGISTIGDACFSGCNYLVSLRLPDQLEVMECALIESCMRLMDFSLPQGLKKIEQGTLWFNTYLETLMLPEGLETIEAYNFLQMDGLMQVEIDPNNKFFQFTEDGLLLTADGTRLIHCIEPMMGEKTEIIIPDGVKVIDDFAFHYNYMLERVVLPESVERIGMMAFAMCPYLQEMVIPSSVTQLGISEEGGRSVFLSYKTTTIITPEGSPAWQWAEENGLPTKQMEGNEAE